jgi:hypothetical protein
VHATPIVFHRIVVVPSDPEESGNPAGKLSLAGGYAIKRQGH